MTGTEHPAPSRLRSWMLKRLSDTGKGQGVAGTPRRSPRTAGQSWYRVMCLTGYFSTLGYQPGIAATDFLITITLSAADARPGRRGRSAASR
jgi:hypothetical protein